MANCMIFILKLHFSVNYTLARMVCELTSYGASDDNGMEKSAYHARAPDTMRPIYSNGIAGGYINTSSYDVPNWFASPWPS